MTDARARTFALAGGVVFMVSLAYGAWSYAVPFGVTTTSTTPSAAGLAVAFDVLLFTGFALHHSVCARLPVRGWIAERVSPRLERSLYVWIASVLFIAVLAVWQPVPGELWRVAAPWSAVFGAVQIAGVLVALRASAALDNLSLSGVRQAFDGADTRPAHLVQTGLYGVVRHPVYFAWVLMVWATPAMTGTRLAFAAVSTLYLVLAVPFEERTLGAQFGPAYASYAARVKWKIVPGLY